MLKELELQPEVIMMTAKSAGGFTFMKDLEDIKKKITCDTEGNE